MKKRVRNNYLFLADDNVRDIHLSRQVSHERPYEKDYGMKEKVWESSVVNLSATKRTINENYFL